MLPASGAQLTPLLDYGGNGVRDPASLAAWQSAASAYERGDLTAAARGFADAAQFDPSWPEPAFRSCLVNLQRGAAGAGAQLQDLLTRFPAHAAGWELIGRFLLTAGKAEAALVCFRRAESQGTNAAISLLIGSALRALGRTAEAAQAFALASHMNPASTRARFLHAVCAQDLGDWLSAAADYREILVRDPELVEASVNLGIVLQAMRDLDGAKSAYGAALRLRADAFGRISQALTMAPKGELWLDLGRLRGHLVG